MAKKHHWIGGTCIKCGLIRTPVANNQGYQYYTGTAMVVKRPDCKTEPKNLQKN